MRILEHIVTPAEDGQRVKHLLRSRWQLSTTLLKHLKWGERGRFVPSRRLHHRDGTSGPAQSHFFGLKPTSELYVIRESFLKVGQHFTVTNNDASGANSGNCFTE